MSYFTLLACLSAEADASRAADEALLTLKAAKQATKDVAKQRKVITSAAKQAAAMARAKQAARAKAVKQARKEAAKQARKEAALAKAAAKAAAKQWVAEQRAKAQQHKAFFRVAKEAAKQARAKAKQRKVLFRVAKAAAAKVRAKAAKARKLESQRAKTARVVARAAKKAASIALKDRDRRLKASATDFPSPKRGTKRKYSGGRDQAQANEVAETAKKMRVARVTLSRVIAQQREYEQAVGKLAMEPVEEDDYSELMDVCDDCDAAPAMAPAMAPSQWDEAESVWDQCFE